jgi:hypothetical protein
MTKSGILAIPMHVTAWPKISASVNMVVKWNMT